MLATQLFWVSSIVAWGSFFVMVISGTFYLVKWKLTKRFKRWLRKVVEESDE